MLSLAPASASASVSATSSTTTSLNSTARRTSRGARGRGKGQERESEGENNSNNSTNVHAQEELNKTAKVNKAKPSSSSTNHSSNSPSVSAPIRRVLPAPAPAPAPIPAPAPAPAPAPVPVPSHVHAYLKPRFQIGSIAGRADFEIDERVFHPQDMPEKAKVARALVSSMVRSRLLSRSDVPWNSSASQQGVGVGNREWQSGMPTAAWDTDDRRWDDRFYHKIQTTYLVEKAKARLESIRRGDDPDFDDANINPRWNCSTFVEPPAVKLLSSLAGSPSFSLSSSADLHSSKQARVDDLLPENYTSLVQREREFANKLREEKRAELAHLSESSRLDVFDGNVSSSFRRKPVGLVNSSLSVDDVTHADALADFVASYEDNHTQPPNPHSNSNSKSKSISHITHGRATSAPEQSSSSSSSSSRLVEIASPLTYIEPVISYYHSGAFVLRKTLASAADSSSSSSSSPSSSASPSDISGRVWSCCHSRSADSLGCCHRRLVDVNRRVELSRGEVRLRMTRRQAAAAAAAAATREEEGEQEAKTQSIVQTREFGDIIRWSHDGVLIVDLGAVDDDVDEQEGDKQGTADKRVWSCCLRKVDGQGCKQQTVLREAKWNLASD